MLYLGSGESEVHRRCKKDIYDAFMRAPHFWDVRSERHMKDVRPDVSARIGKAFVAIEVQISTIPVEEVIRRTKEYTRRGIHLLWLAQWTPSLLTSRYSPELWERWLHAAYFGRVYYWQEGTQIVPYHFDPVWKSVRKRTWHDADGTERSAAGYNRVLWRYKKPVRGATLDLLTDFGTRERDWWKGGDFEIPAAKLFADTKPAFWEAQD